MRKLLFLCGPAGIGKSHFAHQYSLSHPNEKVVVVASDEIRKKLCGSYLKFPKNHNMALIYDTMIAQANDLRKANDNITVILDTTMLNDERRLYFLNRIDPYDESDLILLKLHDYSLCFQRNHARNSEKWVPEEVISDMIRHYEDPSPETAHKFSKVETIYVD